MWGFAEAVNIEASYYTTSSNKIVQGNIQIDLFFILNSEKSPCTCITCYQHLQLSKNLIFPNEFTANLDSSNDGHMTGYSKSVPNRHSLWVVKVVGV